MRDVCSTKLLNTPPDLGGPGVVVQIDESLFNHTSKYQRGRRPDKETWVFGIADTSTKLAVTYMQTVAKRDAETLLPIVYSDEWHSYTFSARKVAGDGPSNTR